MKFTQAFFALACAVAPVLGASTPTFPLVYDTLFDNALTSMTAVTCSSLAAKYPTIGDIPNFPFVGGAFTVATFDSTECGGCWQLDYTTEDGKINVIHLTAISSAPSGFISSLTAEQALTNLPRDQIPSNVQVRAKKVHPSACGL